LIVDIHFCLAAIAAETNDHDSRRFHKKQALAKQLAVSKRLDVIDVRLAMSHQEWGIALIQDGQYEDAIEEIWTSLNIDKELGAYPYNWNAETNLGLAYILKGDLEMAEEVLIGTLERREEKYGKNDTDSFRPGRLFHACGRLRAAQGRYDESFDFYERSLVTFEATIGKNHHRYADICHLIAANYIRRKQHEQALVYIDQALSAWEFDANVFREEIARTTFLKASVLYTLGKEMRAKVLLRRACALRREVVKDSKKDEELGQKDFDDLVTFWSK